jgi:hypothetical protein
MEPRIPKYVPVANVVLKFLTRRGIKAGPAPLDPRDALGSGWHEVRDRRDRHLGLVP